jgi:hypothetical protein
MASERYRKNVISQILDVDGRMVSDHGEKGALFYIEFNPSMMSSLILSCLSVLRRLML